MLSNAVDTEYVTRALRMASANTLPFGKQLVYQTPGPLQNRCTDSLEITRALSDAGLIAREPACVSTPVPVGEPDQI